YSFPQATELLRMLDCGAAQLFLTGYACNLLNLRPEICSLLIIHDPKWHLSDKIRTNWEFLSQVEAHETRRESVYFTVDVSRQDDIIANQLKQIPGTFVPPGAAAFWLGVD